MLPLRQYLYILIVLTIVVSNPVLAVAQHHGHKSPHGGIVQEAEGTHIEFLLDKSGEPKLYLYDTSIKPLERSDLEAKLTIKGHGGAEHTGILSFSKDPKEGPLYKSGPIKDVKDWDSAVVSIKFKDRWTEIRFSNHSTGKAGD